MKLFAYYERQSPLHRRNPFIKLVALAIVALVVTPDFKPGTPWLDPGVPLVFLSMLVLQLSIFGHVPLGAVLRPLLLLALPMTTLPLLGAFSFDPSRVANPRLLVSLGARDLYLEGMMAGLGVGLRLLTYAACALAFIITTDPAALSASLMRQMRLAPSLSYHLLGRARFMAMSGGHLDILRAAHRLRGASQPRGPLRRLGRYAATFLAAWSRSASRAAIAREARSFDPGTLRTIYRQTPVTPFDWSFLMAVIGTTLVMIEVMIFVGMIG